MGLAQQCGATDMSLDMSVTYDKVREPTRSLTDTPTHLPSIDGPVHLTRGRGVPARKSRAHIVWKETL